MSLSVIKIKEIVAKASTDEWGVPEFQRGFVWKPGQVRDLADSLWRGYPAGYLLLWESKGHVAPRVSGGKAGTLWLVDGQQRSTAVCLLFGVRPYWWADAKEWERLLGRCDVRFDVAERTKSPFLIASAAIRKQSAARFIPLKSLLTGDGSQLGDIATAAHQGGFCGNDGPMVIYQRLADVRQMIERDLPAVTVTGSLEAVVDIFGRINSRGSRVTEADIYLGVLATKLEPGWVRGEFLGYLEDLREAGYEFEPNLLFRCLTALGTGQVSLKSVRDSFWSAAEVKPAFAALKGILVQVRHELRDHGVTGTQLLPSRNALIPLLYLRRKWPAMSFDQAFHWFVSASVAGRYSGATETALAEDLKAMEEAPDGGAALQSLHAKIGSRPPFTADDFKRDYGDWRAGRFLLYLMVYAKKARDWDRDHPLRRIGFDGVALAEGFQPQWHHVFPRKFLASEAAIASHDETFDSLGNIAIIGPRVNIRISSKSPMSYIDKEAIDDDRLRQQMIPLRLRQCSATDYPAWLDERSALLADEANAYLDGLAARD